MIRVICLKSELDVRQDYRIFKINKISFVSFDVLFVPFVAYFGAMSFNRRLRPFLTFQ
jgi:hypothetical protein